MNENIKKLLEDATEVMDDYETGSSHHLVDYRIFAENIIRECIQCSTWVGEVNKNPVEPIHTAHAINKRIKKHFGVE